jgi:hypothetical protein
MQTLTDALVHDVVYVSQNDLAENKTTQTLKIVTRKHRLEVPRRKRCLRLRVLVVIPISIRVEVLPRLSSSISLGVRSSGGGGGRLTAEVLLALGGAIAVAGAHGRHGAALLGHLHLGLVALAVLGAHGGEEVDEEAEHVPRVDEGDGPFEYRGHVPVVVELGYAEDDAKADFWGMSVCMIFAREERGRTYRQ